MNKFFLITYCVFIILVSIFTYAFIDPNFIYLKSIYSGFAFTNRFLVSVTYIAVIFLFFFFYYYFIKQAQKGTITRKRLTFLIGISSLLLFSYSTIVSYDIFNYLATAKVAFFYKENPYIVMPIEFSGDNMLLYTRAANKYALYGPLWILLSGVPYVLGGGMVILQAFFLKVFAGIFYVGISYIIYVLSRKNITSTLFFALNPLVLIETFVSGHNDSVMMFLVLLSFLCFKRKRLFLFGIFFILSIFIKYATIFLVPVVVYMEWLHFFKKNISWQKIYIISLILMGIIFVLSPIREEMYPWYAIWLIPFGALIRSRGVKIFLFALSLGLLLSYTPYMYTGQYLGASKLLKIGCILLPTLLSLVYLTVSRYKKA